MNNNDAVFEHIINQLRAHNANKGDVTALEAQLRDSSALVAELYQTIAELNETVETYVRANYELNRIVKEYRTAAHQEPEQAGCRKDDTQVESPWIKWEGGKCPVPYDTMVEVKFRNGEIREARSARGWGWGWGGGDGGFIIVAYRVVKEACKHPASQVCEDTGRCTYCGAVVIE